MIYFFGVVNLFLIFMLYVQIKARLKHEQALFNIHAKILKTVKIMKQLDKTGAFQSHDEVGKTFYLLSLTIQQLENYFLEQVVIQNDEDNRTKQN